MSDKIMVSMRSSAPIVRQMRNASSETSGKAKKRATQRANSTVCRNGKSAAGDCDDRWNSAAAAIDAGKLVVKRRISAKR
jgi:hypothetical protein